MNGVINICKSKGMTSHDVVAAVRKILKTRKVGHTGTLDPDATGVLPICVGRATKTADMLTAADKQYIAEVTLGSRTDTMDSSGTVLETADIDVNKERILETIKLFEGDIEQIPPMYSAIKVGGKKLYEFAREGIEVEVKPRKIRIDNISLLEYFEDKGKFTIKVDCSKGTYIRSLCDDIGRKLGCFAHMSALERTKSGRFSIDDTYTLDEVRRLAEDGDFSFFTPIDAVFEEYPKIYISSEDTKRVLVGGRIKIKNTVESETYRVYDDAGKFLTISVCENGVLKILKTFYQE